MYLTVTPGKGGRVNAGLSPDAVSAYTPDGFVEYLADLARVRPTDSPPGVRVKLADLYDAPLLGLIAMRRLAAVTVYNGSLEVEWNEDHSQTFRCLRSKKPPQDHPARELIGPGGEDYSGSEAALAALIVFDGRLWESVGQAQAALALHGFEPESARTTAEFLVPRLGGAGVGP